MENSAKQNTNSQRNDTSTAPKRHEREGEDRRRRPTPMFSRFLFAGKRRWNRREADPKSRYYVDRFGGKAWAAVIIILALCGADSFFTWYHINHSGATEANPAMDWLMRNTGDVWWIVKYLVTVVALFFLFLHKNFMLARVSTIIIVLMYIILMAYHLSPFFF